ncbi:MULTISPECIES: deoxyribose-phosphate aldolase [Clostridia]|nr:MULTISPECIES: deoxyribose-phosphate aldolase [Clostridia]MBS1481675.1 deoxyribose-phosphate aldolase [Clostridium sp.]MBT9812356.1 deoxyribose-phosphate aldolase [Enterocloster citroniae]MCB7065916.1 deoxyribose-phosphate aldolase [Enterocloster citroniae]MCC8087224.1 deoxyribose-phosphate aldolase [Clostridium sp.]RGC06921.1 deoxyribose-phosphate aldolase [Enterocloster citroniae]
MNRNKIAKMCDHTLLKAFAEEKQIEVLCREAVENKVASVCVNPCYVAKAAQLLKGSDVRVCTVIGFPLGANTSDTKAFETRDAISKGAEEVDMVINVGALKSGHMDLVYEDIKAVVDAAAGVLTKVIIETCYLTDEEKREVCLLAKKAGADFVKTSTGFGTGGATAHDVRLMKETVGDSMKVKASGGMRTYEDVLPVLEAGADRLGVSATLEILAGAEAHG